MKSKALRIAAIGAAAAVLAVAGGPGGWAAGGLIAALACYLQYRRSTPADYGPERFFSDAGEETELRR